MFQPNYLETRVKSSGSQLRQMEYGKGDWQFVAREKLEAVEIGMKWSGNWGLDAFT